MPTKTQTKYQSLPKKSYSSPQLTYFGTIKGLTSGGTGTMQEMGAQAIMMFDKFP